MQRDRSLRSRVFRLERYVCWSLTQEETVRAEFSLAVEARCERMGRLGSERVMEVTGAIQNDYDGFRLNPAGVLRSVTAR